MNGLFSPPQYILYEFYPTLTPETTLQVSLHNPKGAVIAAAALLSYTSLCLITHSHLLGFTARSHGPCCGNKEVFLLFKRIPTNQLG